MATRRRLPTVTFDGDLMTRDAAGKGWGPQQLADATPGISQRTVYRFLSNEVQTVTTAKALAKALGYSVRRYLISAKAVA